MGVRLTLPGDATATHGMETVPFRHKFTDSSLLAVNATRQELLSRWYTHTHTRARVCYIPNSCYESTPRVMNLADSLPNVNNPCSSRYDAPGYSKNALAGGA